jgi:2-polyprenyl-6-methoxyphenol hydroxylase-like FAD-dependent oxidoreductase
MEPPILIVGAGPTGLVLALWLAKSAIPFRIIEKNSGPGQASRAMAVQARTLEFYRQLGIADQIIDAGIKMNALKLRKGSREIASLPFTNISSDISPFPFVLSFPQDDHERMLTRFLQDLDVHVEWNTQLVGFNHDDSSVRATLRKNDAEESAEFAYLCGCDGAHSTVRQNLKLGFPGGTYEESFYVADVQAAGIVFNQNVNICVSPGSFMLAFPVRSSGMFRLIGVIPNELSGREHITFDDIRPYVKQQMDVDVQNVNWFSTYRVHHRVADHFRQGCVFIAGDAGHVHSPAGGQGMNTGIGDAVNLAWKLADVIRGRANTAILDTYESERIAFARTLVATTDRIFETVVGTGVTSKFFRRFFAPDVAPLLLRLKAVRRAQFRLVSQIRIEYRSSPMSQGEAGSLHGGDRLPWLPGQDNFKPLETLNWQLHLCGTPSDALREFAAQRALPLHSFAFDDAAKSAGFVPGAAYLVRPDGYVALAQPDQNTQTLNQFLSKWLTTSPVSHPV